MSVLDFTSSEFFNSLRRQMLLLALDGSDLFSVGEKIALIRLHGLDGQPRYDTRAAGGYVGLSGDALADAGVKLELLGSDPACSYLPELDGVLLDGGCFDEKRLAPGLRQAYWHSYTRRPYPSSVKEPAVRTQDGLFDRVRDLSLGWILAPYLLATSLITSPLPLSSPVHWLAWGAMMTVYMIMFLRWSASPHDKFGPDWRILRGARRLFGHRRLGSLGWRPNNKMLRRLVALGGIDALAATDRVLLYDEDDHLLLAKESGRAQSLPAGTSEEERTKCLRGKLIPDLLAAVSVHDTILSPHLLLTGLLRACAYCGLEIRQISAPAALIAAWYDDECAPTRPDELLGPPAIVGAVEAYEDLVFTPAERDDILRISVSEGDEDPEVLSFRLALVP